MPTLPTDVDGKLVAYTSEQIAAMQIRRRGGEEHVAYNLGPDGAGCTRKFSCAWGERFNASIYFAGAAVQWFDAGDPKISRLVPQVDPDFPNWHCTKCEIMPWRYTGTIDAPVAGSEPLPVYERADLVCTYEMVPFEVQSDADTTAEIERYVTKPGFPGADISGNTQYISLPGGVQIFRTDDGTTKPANVQIPHGIGFPESKRTFKVIWQRVPFDAWGPGTILFNRVWGTENTPGIVGALNKTTFLGYWSLHLMLMTVEERLRPDPTGLGYAWDLGFVIEQKPVPFGHLGLWFHDPAETGNVAGYYQVGTPKIKVTQDANAITDGDAMFRVREYGDLFVVGSVTP